ncbi:molybdate ABC transporter permease subunit, partial [Streptosporangium saharense]
MPRSRGRPRRSQGRPPWLLLLPAALGVAFLVLPLAGLLVRAPWPTMAERLAEPQVLQALRLSLVTATLATLACLVLGVPLAWLLARVTFPGRRPRPAHP